MELVKLWSRNCR